MFRVNVQNISKSYKIYKQPRDRLMEAVLRKPKHTVFKALEDVSFHVGIGRSFGVIGDNGAGKSTLLKLLAGTVRPTRGSIEVNGRVAALLELGAGFHPEFTGRQNIHLNASLLGIPEAEIREKEADIIAFSELGEFIDRPVRTYSSGMTVRLAFSIATTVEPEILIIDEALAVGDIAFQRKCIQRMNRFRDQGNTMLFCSHSMYHIQELCDQVAWLDKGRVREMGACEQVVGKYEDFCSRQKKNPAHNRAKDKLQKPAPADEHQPEKDCRILSFKVSGEDGQKLDPEKVDTRNPIVLEMAVEVLSDKISPCFGFAVMKDAEEILGAGITAHDKVACGPYAKGQRLTVRYVMENIPIRFGSFLLLCSVGDETGLWWYDKMYAGPFAVSASKGVGMISIKGAWELIE